MPETKTKDTSAKAAKEKDANHISRSGVVPLPHAVGATQMADAVTASLIRSLEVGDIVEGTVIAIEGSSVYVDIPPHGTGIIYGREYLIAKDMVRNVNRGDVIKGKIVERENANGYIELSLKEARQALVWSDAESLLKSGEAIELPIKEANKGGLILEWQGIEGFLPASQLKGEHYPRVDDGNKDEIIKELRKLVGQNLQVVVIGVQPKEGKLIFSEKGSAKEGRKEISMKYAVGDVADTTVSGIVDFGIFLKLEEGLEGLVHISEVDWSLVENLHALYKMGDPVQAKIIEIKDGKISLSIKALKPDPWNIAAEKYVKDQEVSGVVIKFNKHGALVSIEEGVAGLVHVSEFGDEKALKAKLSLGKSYKFKITFFEPKEHRMTLSYVG